MTPQVIPEICRIKPFGFKNSIEIKEEWILTDNVIV
jgi:hypothetical protein